MKTINNLVNTCIHQHNLKNSQKNRKKIQAKIRRVIISDPDLKSAWEKAKTQKQGRATVKLLSDKTSAKILIHIEPYLQKLIYKERNLDSQEITGLQAKEQKNIDKFYQKQEEEIYNPSSEIPYPSVDELKNQLKEALSDYQSIYDPSHIGQFINNLMIKAIFEALYTPIDTDKLLSDIALKLDFEQLTEPHEARPKEAIAIEENLKHPLNHYFKKRYNDNVQNQRKEK